MVATGKMNDMAARNQITKFVEDQAIATGYSVNDLTEAVYQGASGFLNFKDSMNVATISAKLARVTNGGDLDRNDEYAHDGHNQFRR